MELSHWNKKEQAPLVEFLGASLLSHPLMMYYCPDRDKREKFITRYMEHNLPRWIQTGTVLVSDPAHAVGVLLSKDAPEYRSPSKGALSMLSGDRFRRIQSHRNVTRNIVGVMIPREKPVQVLTLFGNAAAQKQELLQLVSEAQDLADEKQFVLVYDTFSRRLVDALAETGRLENTVVFYTSDHGCHFKTRNLEYKRSPHDASIHTPLIIWGGAFRGGKTADYPTSLIDLPATLLDVAGIEVPKSFAGKSLLKVQKGEDKPREAVFVQVSESQTARAVRTSRYTYSVRSLNPPYISGRMGAKVYFEDYLYDLEKDPIEKHNLIKDPKYASERKKLKEMLIREMTAAGEKEPKILPAVFTRKK